MRCMQVVAVLEGPCNGAAPRHVEKTVHTTWSTPGTQHRDNAARVCMCLLGIYSDKHPVSSPSYSLAWHSAGVWCTVQALQPRSCQSPTHNHCLRGEVIFTEASCTQIQKEALRTRHSGSVWCVQHISSVSAGGRTFRQLHREELIWTPVARNVLFLITGCLECEDWVAKRNFSFLRRFTEAGKRGGGV